MINYISCCNQVTVERVNSETLIRRYTGRVCFHENLVWNKGNKFSKIYTLTVRSLSYIIF